MHSPVVVGPVQEQVHQIGLPELPVEVIGVLQVLVVVDRTEHRIVVNRREPQPAPIPVLELQADRANQLCWRSPIQP